MINNLEDGVILKITAKDGYVVTVIKYQASAAFRGRLIIAGATGVPQKFYRRFANFLARNGLEVWTIDYRGIGLSEPESLKGFKMNYLDWARLDLASLVDHVSTNYDGPIWMVGHSYGGHAFGLIPNSGRITRFVTFATGAGWAGWMPKLEQIRVHILWNIVGPAIVRWKGFLAWSLLGLGEDLPKDVYLQWRRWCKFPHYFFDDPLMSGIEESFAAVTTPIRAINSIDDKWAPPSSRDAFMKAFKNTKVESVSIDPRKIGMKQIGHMNYFRPEAMSLWEDTLAWLISEKNTTANR